MPANSTGTAQRADPGTGARGERPPGQDFNSESLPSQTFNEASHGGKPKNLVILLQESLGAQFVGSLGGLPLTPNIDALSREGWAFEQLYATGTRSVRGIEAVLTGFTPTPAQAVVKLGKSQTNFFTIADLLKQRDYDTSFIYGGESHFDNMRSFFLGNGFTTIVEQKDFKNPVFEGSWGASDEDLMAKANDTFEALHKQGKPFFSLVFSSSNHDPFEFPDHRISSTSSPRRPATTPPSMRITPSASSSGRPRHRTTGRTPCSWSSPITTAGSAAPAWCPSPASISLES